MAEITEKRFPRIVFTDSQDNSDIGGGGSSDFSIAKVTVSVDGETPVYTYSVIPEDNCITAIYAIYEGMTAEVPVYGDGAIWYYNPESFNCVGTGDVTIPEDDNSIVIFGDCTLTFTTKGGEA